MELQAMLLAARPKKERQNILGEPSAPDRAKRPKTSSVLELWGAR
jgi:hypothetical protein